MKVLNVLNEYNTFKPVNNVYVYKNVYMSLCFDINTRDVWETFEKDEPIGE